MNLLRMNAIISVTLKMDFPERFWFFGRTDRANQVCSGIDKVALKSLSIVHVIRKSGNIHTENL